MFNYVCFITCFVLLGWYQFNSYALFVLVINPAWHKIKPNQSYRIKRWKSHRLIIKWWSTLCTGFALFTPNYHNSSFLVSLRSHLRQKLKHLKSKASIVITFNGFHRNKIKHFVTNQGWLFLLINHHESWSVINVFFIQSWSADCVPDTQMTGTRHSMQRSLTPYSWS